VGSENAQKRASKRAESASENTQDGRRGPRGRAPADLPEAFGEVLASYVTALAAAPLSAQTRRTYASKVRQYLVWLAGAEVDGDPLGAANGRDWAVRDYRGYLQGVLKRSPATINNALAAVDDFYSRRGLGPARAKRAEVPAAAPRALTGKAQIRYLRAVQACESARDRALALVPFYAGTRIAETVALDVDDVRLSARKGVLQVLGKGERLREVPIHPQLRVALTDWLAERRAWSRASESEALFLNRRGGRLSVRGAHDVITGLAGRAGLDDSVTAHVLRHSFATTLVRGGTDLVLAAELLGHARLETTRAYTWPSAEDRRKAVELLPVDE
jgi:site-specific recombinase XerD